MAGAANYAWVNRSTMTFLTRQAFGKVFKTTPDDLDMHVIYDVSHNIAKIEEHVSLCSRVKKVLTKYYQLLCHAILAARRFDYKNSVRYSQFARMAYFTFVCF